MPNPELVFISYAREDNEDKDKNQHWLDLLLQQLQPLIDQEHIAVWSDKQVEPGVNWHQEIQSTLKEAKIFVLLVSPAFLASNYIRSYELPVIFSNYINQDKIIIPVILRHCLFEEVIVKFPDSTLGPQEFSLSLLQSVNPPDKPLSSLVLHEQEKVLLDVAKRINKFCNSDISKSGQSKKRNFSGDVQFVSVSGVNKDEKLTEIRMDLIKKLNGEDPILSDDASNALLTNHKDFLISSLVPIGCAAFNNLGSRFMGLITNLMGERIVPHLIQDIINGSWESKLAAAGCFSNLRKSQQAKSALSELITVKSLDYDVTRATIKALGLIGADWCSRGLIDYAKYGRWKTLNEISPSYLNEDSMHKLSLYVLDALTRFAAKPLNPDYSYGHFKVLTEFIKLRGENSCSLVGRLCHEFTPPSIDAMIDVWGNSEDEELQYLCVFVLRHIAPSRSAKFLLDKAVSLNTSDLVRREASIALGEIRLPIVAEYLSARLKNTQTDRTYLDWAFSTLYALPADWSGLYDYVDEILTYDNEQSCRMRYSLAIKRDNRCRRQLIDYLEDSTTNEHKRWKSALALARLLGPESRKYLDSMSREANSAAERCGMYAAVIQAGNSVLVDSLHESLCEVVGFCNWPTVWKLEILDAFRIVQTSEMRVFELWAQVGRIGKSQIDYFNGLINANAS